MVVNFWMTSLEEHANIVSSSNMEIEDLMFWAKLISG